MATEIPASPARGWRQASDSKSLAEVHGSVAVPEGSRRHTVVLTDGTRLVLSRSRADRLRDWQL